MRHLIPFHLYVLYDQAKGSDPRNPPRDLTERDLFRIKGMAEELRSHWMLESQYLKDQLVSLSVMLISPVIGATLFGWGGMEMVLFIYIDLCFMVLGDWTKYWFAPKVVLAQGLAMQRSLYATVVLRALVKRNPRRKTPRIARAADSDSNQLRYLFMEPTFGVLLFGVMMWLGTSSIEPSLGPEFYLMIAVSLAVHLGQSALGAIKARKRDAAAATCVLPQSAAGLYLAFFTALMFFGVMAAIVELFEVKRPGLAYLISVVIVVSALRLTWRHMINSRVASLDRFLAAPLQHWADNAGIELKSLRSSRA
ncbi:MAG: hypothetical protein QNJ40_26855 [Xanthomonadales bacterium]|nr:hypothetical protein [Xanthomonadales bacterium]